MEIFKNPIEIKRFNSTNYLWNNLHLNIPWSVGYVTYLIAESEFDSKEEWENYYYESGAKRIEKLNCLEPEVQNMLNTFNLDERRRYTIEKNIKRYNLYYGRTQIELEKKANILFRNIKHNVHDITEEECFQIVRFRVICETWNGLVIREKNTLDKLVKLFPEVKFLKTTPEFDYRFAVDYEIEYNGQSICGLQIKPTSYRGDRQYIEIVRRANARKNKEYFNKYGRAVYYIYSQKNGTITNPQILQQIRTHWI